MATLRDVLIRRYGYDRDDFGSAGMVRLDCVEGTLSPVPMHDIFTPRRGNPAKVVRLVLLFRSGQVVTAAGIGRAPALDFTVARVDDGGLAANFTDRTSVFLPWERLRHALMRPELLIFHGNFRQGGGARDGGKTDANSLCTARRLAL